MTIEINSAVNLWSNPQWNVLYEGSNAPKYPQIAAILVKTTDDSLYYSGRILSIYTAAGAPDASLIGTFVNYDPESDNPDQLVPTHVICDEWVNGVAGLDITDIATTTNTFNQVNVAPLLTGTTLYYNTLETNNPAEVMTGFNAYFIESTINNILLNSVSCPVISIQGVQG